MTTRKTNIKQHYVPQFYLRNFSNNSGKIYVHDINRKKDYQSSPKKECYEKLFYDIDPNILDKFTNDTKNYEEIVDDKIRVLNEEVSSILLKYIRQEVEKEENFEFHRKDKEKLYDFILLQFIRSPFYRRRLSYLIMPFILRTEIKKIGNKDLTDVIHNLLLYGFIEKLYDLNFSLNHMYHLFFDHLIREILSIKDQLSKSNKLFLINDSNQKFITSNTPLAINWKNDQLAFKKALITHLDKEKPLKDIGNYLDFSSIYLPIGSNLSIFFFDKNLNSNLNRLKNGIGVINDNNVDLALNLNYSLFLRSQDKVFSHKKDFDKFIRMKNNRINPKFKFEFRS